MSTEWKPSAFMPFFIADYLADTQHLNTEQHGAYVLLLFAAWSRGGTLPDNDEVLRVITRLDVRAWKKHRPVLAEFFTIEDGKWVQKRLAEEMDRAITTARRRSAAGANGASRRWRGDGKGNGPAMANGMANGSQIDGISELTTQTSNKKHHTGAARGRPVDDASGDERAQWQARLNGYDKPGDFWMANHWGPPPDKPGCLAPPDLVEAWRKARGIGPPA